MSRPEGFYKIKMRNEWTIGRWNEQKERMRVDNYDYSEDEIAEIDKAPIDPNPHIPAKYLAVAYQQWHRLNYNTIGRTFRETYDGPWEEFDEALYDYWLTIEKNGG
jgi:hypothetical protein